MNSDAISQNLMPPKAFPYLESELARRSGLGREAMEVQRKVLLVEGVDFVREKRHVALCYDSATRVLAACGVPASDVEAFLGVVMAPEPKNAAQEAVVLLKVHPRRVINAHVLLVTDGKSLFRLRVRNKENFRAGMDVRCEHISGDLYNLIGNAPRFPGKY
jgi:hypothetical protein